MNFSTFLSLPVETFADKFMKCGRILIFQHIPKTAGSSLAREMRLTLPPYANIHVPAEDYAEHLGEADPMDVATETFLAEESSKQFRSASGHMLARHMKKLREALPYAAVFTVLRDPVARVISDYRYSLTPQYPLHEDFRLRFPVIEAYVDCEDFQNTMWQATRTQQEQEASPDAIARVFENLMFIGIVEDLNLHFEFLTALMGYPKTMETHHNVTVESDINKIEITDGLREYITETNAEDVSLYAAVRGRLAEKRDEIVAFVDARRAQYTHVVTPVENKDMEMILIEAICHSIRDVPALKNGRGDKRSPRAKAVSLVRRMKRTGFSFSRTLGIL
ncbi:MAG: sulfotransferase family 2 domain-containing protein [Hyphomonadaceae bacterium]|nr:sulfotransferase family 2 domain-containing protein [Hyphomonadaceae bacterium]MBC6411875.1 sulfotransferase family 2 domain-containing protein [Hyphomonadaceae bacterium]